MNEKFLTLFKEVFEIEDREVLVSDKFRDYPEWDSLAYLSLISMIDEEYDVIIEGKDFNKLQTVQELIDEINKRIA